MKLNFKLYSWIIKGSQRIITVKVMEGKQRPSDICRLAKKLNPKITLNTTSDTLRDFVRMGLAKCLNEEAKTGRIYALTKQGNLIKEELIENKVIESL